MLGAGSEARSVSPPPPPPKLPISQSYDDVSLIIQKLAREIHKPWWDFSLFLTYPRLQSAVLGLPAAVGAAERHGRCHDGVIVEHTHAVDAL